MAAQENDSGFHDTLVANDKYMNIPEEPSPCELECKVQQEAVVACVNGIREQVEGHDRTCLSQTTAAWTSCCANANTRNQ
eukprot:scaffold19088_cov53-Attheya_sp.AAC.4